MIIKDANGKIIGSIEFTEKELDLEKEKFEKITDLGNKLMETTIKSKEENTKRVDKITTTVSKTLHEIADIVKDINKYEYYDSTEWTDEQYNDFNPIDPNPQK